MAGILTNVQAQVALQTLRSATNSLNETQDRISTGLEVRTARDNPSFFLVSQQVRGDNAVLNGLRDNLTLSVNAARTATNGITAIFGTINEIQQALTTADSGQALDELQFTINNLAGEIEGTVNATSFNGINLLAGNNTQTVTTTITRDGGNFNISTFTLVEQNLGDISTFVDATNPNFTLDSAFAAFQPGIFNQIDGVNATGIGANGQLDFVDGGADDIDGLVDGAAGFQVSADVAQAINDALNAFGEGALALTDVEDTAGTGTADGLFELDATAALGTAFSFTGQDGSTVNVNTLGDFINNVVVGDGALRFAIQESGFTGALRAITVNGANGNVQAGLVVADALVGQVNLSSSTLGTFERTLENRQNFLQNLSDSLEQGVASLVEADLDEESTRLQAFQVQQQLAIQALGIANQNPQNILSLFR
ncbi:flagellin [Iodidimonas muriae]|uniref:Flagellin n=1 Tax=Iodidimonas muriae TaxID=261467 RepID=A0ABQ2LFV2_9PROT|nr:flagellin [Iodidimonas muriae]GER08565.1 flagellin [Kordiimonadales bacterium JCM 17843]GGO15621.1 flagellin [Iodidimonas muriae]